MKGKCVFVIGPEGTGSKLIARIISQALDISGFNEWRGNGWCDNGQHKVCHRSLPYQNPPRYPDIEGWILENKTGYEIFFVLTTRDITLSEISRINRFGKTAMQVHSESETAKTIIKNLINSESQYYIWSYETFMFLGIDYLKLLYGFLGIKSNFCPPLVDGNKKKLLGNQN